jgi:hypothetical protein
VLITAAARWRSRPALVSGIQLQTATTLSKVATLIVVA